MSIFNALNAAIYSRLTGGTALTALLAGTTAVFFQQAPENYSGSEFVVFDYSFDSELALSPGREKEELILIKGISETGPALAGSVDGQIDALFHDQTLSVSGWSNYTLRRETGVVYNELDDAGKRFYHAGAFYRILLQQE